MYLKKGDFKKAELMLKRVINIYKKNKGLDNLNLGLALENLAEIYEIKNQYFKSSVYYKKSLNVYIKLKDFNHPDIIISLIKKMSSVYLMQNKRNDLVSVLSKILKYMSRFLKSDHSILSFLNNHMKKLPFTDSISKNSVHSFIIILTIFYLYI